ncbi:Clavaminate synthase-like protein [Epithele typhae]|uniref:Clavaminate synthase-like protein n=1 Tax=Epithele typhae TaxID=378194 RepID=UPI002007EF93|nr:Clavaminate synthase-like protein [Epithele typhae]KAH9911089.1 Clavaminate synthase-like protein [Epithele typhae]
MPARDAHEVEKFWRAATEIGLMNHGVHEEAEGMFAMGEETIALTLKEKLLFEQGDQGADIGTRDVPEFVNIFKDDTHTWPAVARRTYPSAVNAPMESIVTPFVKNSLAINNRPIGVLNDKLGLPEGTLASLHKVEGFSGCTARFIRAPSYPGPEAKTLLTVHINFRSLSLLHNRLGGLQVLPPGSDQWFYVEPLTGHAICNIGDVLNIFSGGILRSTSIASPPPREQAQYERHSVVFFTRPNDTVELRALSAQSERIAAAHAPGVTVMGWLVRMVKSQRVTNYEGAESWTDRRGTEDTAIPSQGKI